MKRVALDARNLLCPIPVIRVQDRVRDLESGTILEAVCTDPGVLNDIPAWGRMNGHRVLETRTEGVTYTVVLEVVDTP